MDQATNRMSLAMARVMSYVICGEIIFSCEIELKEVDIMNGWIFAVFISNSIPWQAWQGIAVWFIVLWAGFALLFSIAILWAKIRHASAKSGLMKFDSHLAVNAGAFLFALTWMFYNQSVRGCTSGFGEGFSGTQQESPLVDGGKWMAFDKKGIVQGEQAHNAMFPFMSQKAKACGKNYLKFILGDFLVRRAGWLRHKTEIVIARYHFTCFSASCTYWSLVASIYPCWPGYAPF